MHELPLPRNKLSPPLQSAYLNDVFLPLHLLLLAFVISASQVNRSLRSTVSKIQQHIPPGYNFMLMNGLAVDIDDFDLYGE